MKLVLKSSKVLGIALIAVTSMTVSFAQGEGNRGGNDRNDRRDQGDRPGPDHRPVAPVPPPNYGTPGGRDGHDDRRDGRNDRRDDRSDQRRDNGRWGGERRGDHWRGERNRWRWNDPMELAKIDRMIEGYRRSVERSSSIRVLGYTFLADNVGDTPFVKMCDANPRVNSVSLVVLGDGARVNSLNVNKCPVEVGKWWNRRRIQEPAMSVYINNQMSENTATAWYNVTGRTNCISGFSVTGWGDRDYRGEDDESIVVLLGN